MAKYPIPNLPKQGATPEDVKRLNEYTEKLIGPTKQEKLDRIIELLEEINTNIKALVGAMAATDQQNQQFIAHLLGGQEKEKTPVDSFFSQGFFKE